MYGYKICLQTLSAQLNCCRGVWQGQVRELLQQQELWRKAAQQSSVTAQGLQQVCPALLALPQRLLTKVWVSTCDGSMPAFSPVQHNWCIMREIAQLCSPWSGC